MGSPNNPDCTAVYKIVNLRSVQVILYSNWLVGADTLQSDGFHEGAIQTS